MERQDKVRRRLNEMLPSVDDKILMIETLLGAGYCFVEFMRKHSDFIEPDPQTAYQAALICQNLVSLMSPIEDGKAVFQHLDLSNEKDVEKKLAFTAKHLYEYCKEKGFIIDEKS